MMTISPKEYDLVPPEPPSPIPPRRRTPPIAYEAPPASQPIESRDLVIDRQMPIALLAGGVFIEIVAAIIRGWSTHTIAAEIREVGIEMIISVVLLFIAMHIAAKFRALQLGDVPTTLLKLAALSIAPAAAVTLFSPALNIIPLGSLLGLAGEFVLWFALIGALFQLDQSDTWYCVCVIFIVHVATYFSLMGLKHLL